nr:hypothetical protein [Tanacetum cinerariifolium]
MELELECTQQGSSYEVSKYLLLSDIEDSVMDLVTHKFNPPSHSRWQFALASDHLKLKRTIESRAKRSSKIISLGHCSILLASSHTTKSRDWVRGSSLTADIVTHIKITTTTGRKTLTSLRKNVTAKTTVVGLE